MKETEELINTSDNKIKSMFGVNVGIKTNLEYSESGYLKIKEWIVSLFGTRGKGPTFETAMANLEHNILSENMRLDIIEKYAVPKTENEGSVMLDVPSKTKPDIIWTTIIINGRKCDLKTRKTITYVEILKLAFGSEFKINEKNLPIITYRNYFGLNYTESVATTEMMPKNLNAFLTLSDDLIINVTLTEKGE